ncbi:sulfatase-like hydrolase/transferase [Streptomyces sp. 3MP-14]|uniref:Sulfatase-like hydrolase/transferase n=1 Tax=Streptomyces mimosae TaxID=2586635 RepID=A0A5N5ZUL8_9ACTN|nr:MULTISPECIES: alkaline phosphatase family protein [Streptomyces]KAB8159572.1 sulfatase-like hydrolase/transferase [Streptomyces mimosae]KAB8172850.1 sulfatase-like hydrolase/transferase [Streptomyces sp. 3MP-14]
MRARQTIDALSDRRRGGLTPLAVLTVLTVLALCAVLLAGGAARGAQAATRGAGPAPRADHVVLLVWDGFDPAYRHRVATPNLDALAERGFVGTSLGVAQSITNPSMSTLATGAFPERHGNTAYVYDPAAGAAVGQSRALAVPTLAESLAAQGRTLASVQWFILQDHGVRYGDPRALYTQPGGTCADRVDQFGELLAGRPVDSGGTPVSVPEIPDLTAVYCDDLDALGHRVGPNDPSIDAQMAEMDRQLGRVVQATRDAGIFERTAFVLVGDHGMTEFDRAFGAELLDAIASAGLRGEFLTSGRSPAPETDVAVVVGGSASLHFLGDADNARNVARVRSAVARLPQVRAVLGAGEQRLLRMSPAMGELVVEPRPGWTAAAEAPAAPAGRHGSTSEAHATLLVAGAGVRAGGFALLPRHVDVAPTVSALLGAEPPAGAQGRVLWEALRPAGGLPD